MKKVIIKIEKAVFIKDLDLTDLPFNLTDREKATLIKTLPMSIKKSIASWGISDTEVRDQIFCFILANQFGMTAQQYYDSEIANLYFKKDITQTFDFKKL
jgi:hypothetical protein